jgi:hypothetical protein
VAQAFQRASPNSSGPPAFTSRVDRSLGPACHQPDHYVVSPQANIQLSNIRAPLARSPPGFVDYPGFAERRRKSFGPQVSVLGGELPAALNRLPFLSGAAAVTHLRPRTGAAQCSILHRRKRRRKIFTLHQKNLPWQPAGSFRRPPLSIYAEIGGKITLAGRRCHKSLESLDKPECLTLAGATDQTTPGCRRIDQQPYEMGGRALAVGRRSPVFQLSPAPCPAQLALL